MVSDNKTKDRDSSLTPEDREMIAAIRAQIKPRPPLTDEERAQAYAALERATAIRQKLFEDRGGRLFPNYSEEFPDVYESIDEDYEPRDGQQ